MDRLDSGPPLERHPLRRVWRGPARCSGNTVTPQQRSTPAAGVTGWGDVGVPPPDRTAELPEPASGTDYIVGWPPGVTPVVRRSPEGKETCGTWGCAGLA